MHRQHLPAVCCEGPLIAADVVPSVGARLESNSYGWGHQFRDDDALYVVHDEDDWETTPLEDAEFIAMAMEYLSNKGMQLLTAYRRLPSVLALQLGWHCN
jgi:hypothetical protein